MSFIWKTLAVFVAILAWAAGRLRGPLALVAALYAAFGGSLFATSWVNPGPWRTTLGIIAGWVVWEICTVSRNAVDATVDYFGKDSTADF